MGMVGYIGFSVWYKVMLRLCGEILRFGFVGKSDEEMDYQNNSESCCTLHCRDISVIVINTLVLVISIVVYVEIFPVLIC